MTSAVLVAFGFGNLAMLGWLAAAAAPIVIHLWSRYRHRELPWAAIELLRAAMQKHARRVRFQQWLLLALRTLLIVLVVMAVAEPFSDTIGIKPAGPVPVHRVLVIDGTMSMAYRTEDERLFDRARRLAQQLVEEARAGDTLTLVRLSQPPQVVVGRPTPDHAQIARELGSLELTHGSGDLPATLAQVQALVDRAADETPRKQRQEVYFFTDLQRASWSPDSLDTNRFAADIARLSETATLLVVDVGQPSAPNAAVTDLAIPAPYVTTGRAVTLQAVVANLSTVPRTGVTLELLVDEVPVAEKALNLAPGSQQTVAFLHHFQHPGSRRVGVRLAGDALPVDDRRQLVLPVKEQVRVLCLAGSRGAADYVADALDPQRGELSHRTPITPIVATDSDLIDLDLSLFDCVVLCNIPQFTEAEAALLAGYLQSGGGLIFFLGDRVLAKQYNRVLLPRGVANADDESGVNILPAAIGELVTDPNFGLDPLDYRHPVVAPFRGRVRAGLLTTPVFRYFQLRSPTADADDTPPGERSPADVALALVNGDPLIVTADVDRGRAAIVATAGSLASVDTATGQPWTTMPAWPSFLPIVRELVAFAMGRDQDQWQFRVSETLSGSWEATTGTDPPTIERPDGRVDPTRTDASQLVREWSYDQTDLSGNYSLLANEEPQPIETFAVNSDPRESDLTRVAANELPAALTVREDWRGDDGSGPAAGVGRLAQRGTLHRTLLALAMAVALVETFLAWLFGRAAA